MEKSEIKEKTLDMLEQFLGVDKDELTDEASLTMDLGADSLDMAELIMESEKEFNISIPDEAAEKVQTVSDMVNLIDSIVNG